MRKHARRVGALKRFPKWNPNGKRTIEEYKAELATLTKRVSVQRSIAVNRI